MARSDHGSRFPSHAPGQGPSIKAGNPAAADFNLGLSGERTVFPKTMVASATWLRQVIVNGPLSPAPINLAPLDVVPGKVGTIAYGRYQSPEYLVHPGEYIPAVGVLELSEMVSQSGLSPALWSRYLRETPLPGSYPKSVVYLFSLGDRAAVNPGTSLLLRAGGLVDRTVYFRTDRAFAQDPAFPREPHAFLINTLSPDPLTRAVALSGQDSIGAFLESDGATMGQPTPADLFEMPIAGPLPESLNYIR